MDQTGFVIPSVDRLDPALIDVFLDVDLDELTILFYGRNREHYVHPVSEVLSYLLDVDTDDVVGVAVGCFAARVLHEHPYMRDVIPAATVLIGDLAGSFDPFTPVPDLVPGRGAQAGRAPGQVTPQENTKQVVRDIMRDLPTLVRSA